MAFSPTVVHEPHIAGDVAEARVDIARTAYQVSISAPGLNPAFAPDAFFALTLFPAMRVGAPLEVRGEVSGTLLGGVERIQQIFCLWNKALQRIEVEAAVRRPEATKGQNVGAFFSGGVDSFYTALFARDVDHLIFVRGAFDTDLSRPSRVQWIAERTLESIRALGKEPIEVTICGRPLSQFSGWPTYHASVLTAAGMIFGSHLHRAYVPSTHSYDILRPWGTHPLVDRLWSTDEVEFVNHGAEVTRVEKVKALATNDVAMQGLRVCLEAEDYQFNCGRCEKCLRTMLALDAVGALKRCRTFPNTIDPRLLRGRKWSIPYMPETLIALEKADVSSALRRAFVRSYRASQRRAAVEGFLPARVIGVAERLHLLKGRPPDDLPLDRYSHPPAEAGLDDGAGQG